MLRASAASTSTPRRAPRTRSSARRSTARSTTGIRRTNKLVLELAKSVTVSDDGLVYTYKLRDDAYFHNGRKMTADDIIWSFTRIMDGTQGLSRRALRPPDQGRGRRREGPGQGDLRPEEDRRLHARDDAHRQRRSGLLLLRRHDRDPARRKRPRRATSPTNPIGLGPFKFKEHVPGSRVVAERLEKFYKPGKPYADQVVIAIMAEAAARDVAFRNKEIDTSILGPGAVRRLSRRPEALQGHPRGRRDVHAPMGMNPELQAVRRQARAAGDQPRDRHRPDHQAAGQGQGLSRGRAGCRSPRPPSTRT